ncbi:MAG: DUF4197 domain-containing protein [Cyclobacteriaceae bacterium]|nr:DUF4197 domain-containing protein [Cyclobacteriaceae bacterium]
MIRYLLISSILIAFTACNVSSWQSILNNSQLTESEVVDGLKTALRIGTEKAVQVTSQKDGYFRDQAIRILLPEEASKALVTLREAPGGEQLYQSAVAPVVDDLVEALNRSAENAASQAAPIFKDAITGMTIGDAWDILNENYQNAGNRSATVYFSDKTYDRLAQLFKPAIDQSLDKPVVNNISANNLWNKFVKSYDAIAKSPANLLMRLEPVKEPDLSMYVTSRALDGLFVKVADEEVKIRKDPYQYAIQILEKVFGK